MLKSYAPAKINLILRILGKREDGYHEIFSLMQRVSLFDTLHFRPISVPRIELKTNCPFLPIDKSNLIYRAASLFFKEVCSDSGISIYLIKRIPISSGLGGGSSDAATTLLSLNKLFGDCLSKKRLLEMAVSLGSDVPFFIFKSTAIVTGRGENVTPIDLDSHFWYIILCPPIRVSTAKIYSSWKLTKIRNETKIPKGKEILRCLENDLEDFAIHYFPEISLAKEILKEVGAVKALMTGSGGAVFGIFFKKKDAKLAKERIKPPKAWRIFLVKGI